MASWLNRSTKKGETGHVKESEIDVYELQRARWFKQ